MVPKIKISLNSGLYADLPRANIASVDLASSNLTISKQITGQSTDAVGTLTITSTDALDTSAGITSAFFETFDAERYGVFDACLLYTSPSPRDATLSRMPSSA